MKTVLTLKNSSMYFIGNVNLYKNIPLEVDSDTLTTKEIQIINQFIKSGSIDSTSGELEKTVVKAKEESEQEAAEETSEVVEETATAEKEEEEPKEVVEKKQPTPRKRATTKK